MTTAQKYPILTAFQTRVERAYAEHMPTLVSYARGVVGDEAEDVAHDAFMEVIGLPDLSDGEIGGLLMQRLKWRAADFLRRREALLEADLGDVEDESDDMRPMQLDDLEATQVHHGATPPWPTAIDHDSPEELVNAAQMNALIREVATEQCSAEDYAMFLAVVVDNVRQDRVAREFRVDQGSVSRAVSRVRDTVAQHLEAHGYNVNR